MLPPPLLGSPSAPAPQCARHRPAAALAGRGRRRSVRPSIGQFAPALSESRDDRVWPGRQEGKVVVGRLVLLDLAHRRRAAIGARSRFASQLAERPISGQAMMLEADLAATSPHSAPVRELSKSG
jgi:hypothetical protein